MRHNLLGCAAAGLLLTAFAGVAQAENRTTPRPPANPKPATAKVPIAQTQGANTASPSEALRNAAAHGKYAFIFFYRSDDERTQQMRKVFDAALGNLADRAEPVTVRVTDPAEKPIVNKFKVGDAPMPFVFSIAPNGAVVRSYRSVFTEQQLADAFVSPGLEKTLKSLQDRKMTFLCVQNSSTAHDAEAMKGVNEFKKDPKYAKTTEVVTIDPSDAAEAHFLRNLKVDPNMPEAVTILIAPPGKIVGTYRGATEKTALVAAVKKASKGCGCKGGCKKPAKQKGK